MIYRIASSFVRKWIPVAFDTFDQSTAKELRDIPEIVDRKTGAHASIMLGIASNAAWDAWYESLTTGDNRRRARATVAGWYSDAGRSLVNLASRFG